jgi:hypothetical protein
MELYGNGYKTNRHQRNMYIEWLNLDQYGNSLQDPMGIGMKKLFP